MGYPDTFEGFTISDAKKWTDFKKTSLKPKPFEENDVDIKIECCGVCGSDVHTITGGWGPLPDEPVCVGHEVIGRAIKVGKNCKTGVKVGDRVGVGAQVKACLECKVCKSDNENYCPDQIDTYGAKYPDGTMSQGGYASHIRVHEYFVFPIPDGIPSHEAAPMMCAGLTVYSPLYRAGTGPGKKVAIMGMGGLGHFAVMFAKAMGAEVTVLSHTPGKKTDALKLGADHFIDTNTKDWQKEVAFEYNFILNASDMTNLMDVESILSTLAVNGEFHNCGLPDEPLPQIKAQAFAPNGAKIGGSHIGCRTEMLKMLKLVGEKKLSPMIETIPISEEGCAKGVTKCKTNDVRYRVTLTDFDKIFGA